MCTICAAFRPYSDACDYAGLAQGGTVSETTDATHSSGTSYFIEVGGTFQGAIGGPGDMDWVEVQLEIGATYEFNLKGAATGNGTLADPVLTLYGGDESHIAGNDDGGTGTDARLSFTATATGSFFLMAQGLDAATGSYVLSVEEKPGAAPVMADLNELADYLAEGYWLDSGRSAHRFDTSQSNQITVNLSGLTPTAQKTARWALEAWEAVADLEFVETQAQAQITFDDSQMGAYASYSAVGGITDAAHINIGTGWNGNHGTAMGTYGFQTYLHEIGHALGLGHQGNYNGGADYGTHNRFVNDSWQNSVMSYFSQNENSALNASYGETVTAMAADILAIQSLYGAAGPQSLTDGKTVYGVGHTLGDSWLGKLYDAFVSPGRGTSDTYDGSPFTATIFDAGGHDTLDFSTDRQAQRVTLREGAVLDVHGQTGNVVIAPGTVIEDFVAGSGNDRVTGNAADNFLRGNDGRDRLDGRAGQDRLSGGRGDDVLDGASGNDVLKGGRDRDTLKGGGGGDVLKGGVGGDLLMGAAGHDTLKGGLGHDRIDGGKGSDTLQGGAGKDTFVFSGGQDRIRDFSGDRLLIDEVLWAEAGLDEADIVRLARIVDGDLVLDFGDGNTLTLEGVSDVGALTGAISLI